MFLFHKSKNNINIPYSLLLGHFIKINVNFKYLFFWAWAWHIWPKESWDFVRWSELVKNTTRLDWSRMENVTFLIHPHLPCLLTSTLSSDATTFGLWSGLQSHFCGCVCTGEGRPWSGLESRAADHTSDPQRLWTAGFQWIIMTHRHMMPPTSSIFPSDVVYAPLNVLVSNVTLLLTLPINPSS